MKLPDRIEIKPGTVSGEVALPGSKSITNRALVLGALARGKTTLANYLRCEDTTVMIQSLLALGFPVSCRDDKLVIEGQGGTIPAKSALLQTMNSGTTMRFLTAAVALGHGKYLLDGNPRMRLRPLAPLLEVLSRMLVRLRESYEVVSAIPYSSGGGFSEVSVTGLIFSHNSQWL